MGGKVFLTRRGGAGGAGGTALGTTIYSGLTPPSSPNEYDIWIEDDEVDASEWKIFVSDNPNFKEPRFIDRVKEDDFLKVSLLNRSYDTLTFNVENKTEEEATVVVEYGESEEETLVMDANSNENFTLAGLDRASLYGLTVKLSTGGTLQSEFVLGEFYTNGLPNDQKYLFFKTFPDRYEIGEIVNFATGTLTDYALSVGYTTTAWNGEKWIALPIKVYIRGMWIDFYRTLYNGEIVLVRNDNVIEKRDNQNNLLWEIYPLPSNQNLLTILGLSIKEDGHIVASGRHHHSGSGNSTQYMRFILMIDPDGEYTKIDLTTGGGAGFVSNVTFSSEGYIFVTTSQSSYNQMTGVTSHAYNLFYRNPLGEPISNINVSGTGSHRRSTPILFFSNDNNFVFDVASNGGTTVEAQMIRYNTEDNTHSYVLGTGFIPRDIALDDEGNIYLVHHNNGELRKYSPDLEHLWTVSGYGTLRRVTIGKDNKIYVYSNPQGIIEFNTNGDYVDNIIESPLAGISNPSRFEVDMAGNFYLVDGVNLYKVDSNGSLEWHDVGDVNINNIAISPGKFGTFFPYWNEE